MLAIEDNRRLPEIAAEFDGIERFERKSDEEGDALYTGYTILAMIKRDLVSGNVQMAFEKEG